MPRARQSQCDSVWRHQAGGALGLDTAHGRRASSDGPIMTTAANDMHWATRSAAIPEREHEHVARSSTSPRTLAVSTNQPPYSKAVYHCASAHIDIYASSNLSLSRPTRSTDTNADPAPETATAHAHLHPNVHRLPHRCLLFHPLPACSRFPVIAPPAPPYASRTLRVRYRRLIPPAHPRGRDAPNGNSAQPSQQPLATHRNALVLCCGSETQGFPLTPKETQARLRLRASRTLAVCTPTHTTETGNVAPYSPHHVCLKDTCISTLKRQPRKYIQPKPLVFWVSIHPS